MTEAYTTPQSMYRLMRQLGQVSPCSILPSLSSYKLKFMDPRGEVTVGDLCTAEREVWEYVFERDPYHRMGAYNKLAYGDLGLRYNHYHQWALQPAPVYLFDQVVPRIRDVLMVREELFVFTRNIHGGLVQHALTLPTKEGASKHELTPEIERTLREILSDNRQFPYIVSP